MVVLAVIGKGLGIIVSGMNPVRGFTLYAMLTTTLSLFVTIFASPTVIFPSVKTFIAIAFLTTFFVLDSTSVNLSPSE